MFIELRRRRRKVGLPPESLVFTGRKRIQNPQVTLISYTDTVLQETTDASFEACLSSVVEGGKTWVNVDGLKNVNLIKSVGTHFGLHPLVLEDILNTTQRPKIEVFDNYVFIILKVILWNEVKNTFYIEQMSIALGEDFVLTFQEQPHRSFDRIADSLRRSQGRVRETRTDYLMYVLIDNVVDQYFIVLDYLGDQIESFEEIVTRNPTQKSLHSLYELKRHVFRFKKASRPAREIINHLLQIKGSLMSDFCIPYLRDIYDHCLQIGDTIETFRDMIGSLLDAYHSNQTQRINEVMKVLTVIATIFIPLTFVASIYGMNFTDMPELHMKYAYPTVLGVMVLIAVIMYIYFKRKNWF